MRRCLRMRPPMSRLLAYAHVIACLHACCCSGHVLAGLPPASGVLSDCKAPLPMPLLLQPEGWPMKQWQYERLIEVVRPDAER